MQFEVKAYREPEGVTLLRLPAADAGEAASKAEAQGYRVIATRATLALPALAWISTGQRFSVPLFSQELLTLMEAGLNLIEAVETLARKARQRETKRILEELMRLLREGRSFSQALGGIPGAFPELYIATVRSSERTGNLIEALNRYLAYHQQINAARNKVISASVYPVLLIVVGTLVILFLLGYVVPRFSRVYEDLGNNLPWMSRLLLQWGHLFERYGGWLGAGSALLLAVSVYGFTRPAVRAAMERFVWRLPSIGEKVQVYQLARFSRTLAMLLKGGVPFVTALGMVGDLLRQPALREGLACATQSIKEGRAVSDAFSQNGLATEVGVRMLVVGERSGELGEMMERIAKLYDDEITRWVEWFSRLFEPILMIIIGLIIGVVVLLMYLPIFELAGAIQ